MPGAIAGIVLGTTAVSLLALVAILLWRKHYLHRGQEHQAGVGSPQSPGQQQQQYSRQPIQPWNISTDKAVSSTVGDEMLSQSQDRRKSYELPTEQ